MDQSMVSRTAELELVYCIIGHGHGVSLDRNQHG